MEKYVLPVIIEKDEDGYFAYCPALQGCYTQGDTYEEAMENIKDAIHLHLEELIASGDAISKVPSFSMSAIEVTVGVKNFQE
ncbi:MAG TPA: type II toxin-antitoxin system HicB family antitoxin [Methanosarcinales archaeon]|nr:type II toxin-antitoxin system HicB family antitoxin [Methanosarcinales archaeon]